MAVTFDSAFEKGASSTTSPFSYVSNAGTVTGAVGANSNRVLIAMVEMNLSATALAVTWNGVSMSSLGTPIATSVGQVALFGLIAPATGAQTISVSWTGGAMDCVLGAISLYDADQTSPFQNYQTDSATGTAVSSTVTSANGNMVVAGRFDDNATTWTQVNGTQAWDERAFNGNQGGAYRASSGASTVISGTLGSSVQWAQAAVDVLAFSGGGGGGAPLMGQACL
jgi:hypothetical protein